MLSAISRLNSDLASADGSEYETTDESYDTGQSYRNVTRQVVDPDTNSVMIDTITATVQNHTIYSFTYLVVYYADGTSDSTWLPYVDGPHTVTFDVPDGKQATTISLESGAWADIAMFPSISISVTVEE